MEQLPLSEVELQMEANVLGPIAINKTFLPLLRPHRGRIINIGSVGSLGASPMGRPYYSSKAALAAFSDGWRNELRQFDIGMMLIEPGAVRTAAFEKASRAYDSYFAPDDPSVGVSSRGQVVYTHKSASGLDNSCSGITARQFCTRNDSTCGHQGDQGSDVSKVRRDSKLGVCGRAQISGEDQCKVPQLYQIALLRNGVYHRAMTRMKAGMKIASAFAMPTMHIVENVDHAMHSRFPMERYYVGFDAKLIALFHSVIPEEVNALGSNRSSLEIVVHIL
ncbi:hypothetical protein BJ742DRAFT_825037 [Cladochytrium replicatum]|nr:hypothetical protein BJ742DRAFT_825037 [Cladochytrium replicatum]